MKTILFQGDSITDADRSYADDSKRGLGYPHLVTSYLGYEYPDEYNFINRGISGNRIVDVYARIKKDIINLKPDYMSLLIGVNDVWHELETQNGVDTPKFEKIYTMLIEEIKQALPQCKIIVFEPFVLKGSATEAKWEEFLQGVGEKAEACRRVAKEQGVGFVPLQQEFDSLCKKAPAEYWIKDGVHPTAAGHQLIARKWLEAFEKIK